MRAEMACDRIRVELSARLDGEITAAVSARLDEHLATCSACRAYEERIKSVRRTLRVQPIEALPDLAPRVMAKIREERSPKQGVAWGERFRIAAIAAAAAALVLFGATQPFRDLPADIATAGEIADGVRSAARQLDAYRAEFRIQEIGWHPEIAERSFEVEIAFRAPEDLHLVMEDRTRYPSPGWPKNDYELVADAERWWIEESSSCPEQGLPACAAPTTWAGVIERRTVLNRQPFDGTTPLPTDMIVPLESLASSDAFQVVGPDRVLDRSTIRVALEYRYAQPLIDSLQVGGAWRPFHPRDRVDVWLDDQSWFPLRYEVTAIDSTDRHQWAQRLGLEDAPGTILLSVVAASFGEPEDLTDAIFDVPVGGIRRDGGFRSKALATRRAPIDPPADLDLYRAGRAADQVIRAYSDGMTYLKVTTEPRAGVPLPLTAEELHLDGAVVYYHPANLMSGRRIDLFGPKMHVRLESNLERADLIALARTASVQGRSIPRVVESGTTTVRRVDPMRALERVDHALRPTYLPTGYRPAAALRSDSPATLSITVYFRHPEAEFEGEGIRLVQTLGIEFLPPSSEEFLELELDAGRARWSTERGELEWIDGDVYRAVAVPSGDLATAVAIAEGLS